MSAPLPPGRTRPANPQPGERDQLRRMVAIASGLTEDEIRALGDVPGEPGERSGIAPETCMTTPAVQVSAPSAGQDTGQLRDELVDALEQASYAGKLGHDGLYRSECEGAIEALLDGPLARLIAERDEARGQVQRVRDALDAPSSGYLDIEIRRALDGQP